ncbi:hypothetical protein CLAIMM_03959 [Cladophialophora immunda]|nr:hypothetical protein CLAIMM_03959 [Cladophialophora immunda]
MHVLECSQADEGHLILDFVTPYFHSRCTSVDEACSTTLHHDYGLTRKRQAGCINFSPVEICMRRWRKLTRLDVTGTAHMHVAAAARLTAYMAQKPQTLDGKLAIVSGSSKGIGAAIAIELASRGALVVTNYPYASLQQEAESTLEKLRATGGNHVSECFAVESDLSTLDGPKHLVDEAVKHTNGRKVDILVNNAGIAKMTPLKDVTVEEWDAQVNLNGRGTLLLTQAVLPHLATPSRIVNLSSSGARQPYPGASIYNGTKSMIESFTRCWAV